MKTMIALAVLVVMSGIAGATSDVTFALPAAQTERVSPSSPETLSSTISVRGYTVATITATNVIFDSSQAPRFVEVQNLDSSAEVVCSESVSVSTRTGSDFQGDGPVGHFISRVASNVYSSFRFPLRAGQNFYCKSTAVGSTAGSKVSVMTGR